MIAIFLLVNLSPVILSNGIIQKNFFVVWNVGQGQWATFIQSEKCLHFDTGGEKMPAKKIKLACGSKRNKLFLSHWDWDHISFAGRLRNILPRNCMALPPVGKSSVRKQNLIAGMRDCGESESQVRPLFRADIHEKGSNDSSHVLMLEKQILIPGDSPSSKERIWEENVEIKSARWLLLGHHGSRGSTSEELLNRLPSLKLAIASARIKKYGHPHIEVVERLRRHSVPILRTEDWGNIWIEVPRERI